MKPNFEPPIWFNDAMSAGVFMVCLGLTVNILFNAMLLARILAMSGMIIIMTVPLYVIIKTFPRPPKE